jgi:protein SCO1
MRAVGAAQALRTAALAVVVGGALGCSRATAADRPATLGRITPEHLVDQDGHAFGATQLSGHVWITALMFSSCPMACPVVAQRMAYLQTLLPAHAPSIRMLSVTLDPENDTPPTLAAFGARYHRDPQLWTLATGATQPVVDVVTAGWARVSPKGKSFDHGDTFTLIDGQGNVRGYYGKDDAGVAKMLADADRIAGDRYAAATP